MWVKNTEDRENPFAVTAIAFLPYITYIDLLLADNEHSRMVENRMNVQERRNERIDMNYTALQFTVLSSTALVLVREVFRHMSIDNL